MGLGIGRGQGWKKRHAKHDPWQNKQDMHYSSINKILKIHVGVISGEKLGTVGPDLCFTCKVKKWEECRRMAEEGEACAGQHYVLTRDFLSHKGCNSEVSLWLGTCSSTFVQVELYCSQFLIPDKTPESGTSSAIPVTNLGITTRMFEVTLMWYQHEHCNIWCSPFRERYWVNANPIFQLGGKFPHSWEKSLKMQS